MKRLFVRPAYRGQGLGHRLAMQAVNEASALGYIGVLLELWKEAKSPRR